MHWFAIRNIQPGDVIPRTRFFVLSYHPVVAEEVALQLTGIRGSAHQFKRAKEPHYEMQSTEARA